MSIPTPHGTIALAEQFRQLATETNSDKRLALLRAVADLYLSHPVCPTLAEEYLFSEIATSVLRKLHPDERPQVSSRLSDSERVPRSLALALAADADIAVASPILSRSPVLTEGDIVALAQESNDARLQAIATRPSLTARVTDVLIDRGSNTVLRTISGNAGAEFSESGMMSLVARARNDSNLTLSLADRGDLSPAMVDQLNTLICDMVATTAGADSTDPAVANLRSRAKALIADELRKRKTNIDSTDRVIESVAAGIISLDDGLNTLFSNGRLLDASQVLAHFLRFDRNFVFQQVATGEIDTVILMFRALGVSYSHMETTLALRARKRRASAKLEHVSQPEYEAVSQADAQRAMRFLNVRITAGKGTPSSAGTAG